jgi:dTMP kinase
MDPLFIVVEGIDGAGSTTCSKLLVQKMVEAKIDCLWTKEPSDGTIGRHIRKILTGQEAADELGMFPLFLADRHDHIASIVRPSLEQGLSVVCDRYAYSTWVYQQDSYDPFFIEYAQRSCLAPDFLFVLNCSVEESSRRLGTRDVVERYEIEEKQRVYAERYTRVPRLCEEMIVNLDSEKDSPEEIVDQIRSVIGVF